jgi:hypothetical protein
VGTVKKEAVPQSAKKGSFMTQDEKIRMILTGGKE